MKTSLILILLILFSSCRALRLPNPPKVHVEVTELKRLAPLPKNVELAVYFEGEENVPEYEKVALIEVYGEPGSSRDQQLKYLKYQAAELGANALVNVESGFKLNTEVKRYGEQYSSENVKYPFMKALAVNVDRSFLPPNDMDTTEFNIYVERELRERNEYDEEIRHARSNGLGVLTIIAVMLTVVLVTT